jgi:hypothetical protein
MATSLGICSSPIRSLRVVKKPSVKIAAGLPAAPERRQGSRSGPSLFTRRHHCAHHACKLYVGAVPRTDVIYLIRDGWHTPLAHPRIGRLQATGCRSDDAARGAPQNQGGTASAEVPSERVGYERTPPPKHQDLEGEMLMYASDYPHGEGHFPEPAGLVARLGNGRGRKRKLPLENAARLYIARPARLSSDARLTGVSRFTIGQR